MIPLSGAGKTMLIGVPLAGTSVSRLAARMTVPPALARMP
jgi:hypothetical protein